MKDFPSLGAIVCSVFEYTHAAQTGSQTRCAPCGYSYRSTLSHSQLTTLTLTCDVRRRNRASLQGRQPDGAAVTIGSERRSAAVAGRAAAMVLRMAASSRGLRPAAPRHARGEW